MRSLVHWDADSFFASIEQAADRRLRGRPLAVGGPRRGVILSASREARRCGVRPGMPSGKARRICPPLIVAPARFELYERFFHEILGLCDQYTPLVEPVAVGAAYLDLTGTGAVLGRDTVAAVAKLRRTVAEWLRVSLSAGVATSKSVARIAARCRKPGAQVVVPPGQEAVFLAPLPLAWLPGLGRQRLDTLETAGLSRIGELAAAPLEALELLFGREALPIQRRAQGIDQEPVRRPVSDPAWRESVEFEDDVWEEPFLLATLRAMLERLMARLRGAAFEVRRLTLTLRYTDRQQSQRSETASEPTNLEVDFDSRLPALLRSAWSRRVRLRGLSLSASSLYRPSPQLDLFPMGAEERRRECALAAAIDALRRKYGESAVWRGYRLTAPA